MAAPEAVEGRNFYRRFMSTVGVDRGWLTGPVYGLTVQIPGLAGMFGTIGFSAEAIGELTQDRPVLLAQAITGLIPPGILLDGVKAVREMVATGNLEQAGIHTLLAVGSAALTVGAGFLGYQAELGMEDSRRAEAEARHRYYLSQYQIRNSNSPAGFIV